MTYLRPKQWWGYLFIPFWRCQNKTIREQWAAGVRCFDLRVTFEEYGKPVFTHGIVRLKTWEAIASYYEDLIKGGSVQNGQFVPQ